MKLELTSSLTVAAVRELPRREQVVLYDRGSQPPGETPGSLSEEAAAAASPKNNNIMRDHVRCLQNIFS